MKYKRVTYKESKSIRSFGHEIINELRIAFKDKYRFAHRLVGSAKWNTILKDENGWWDLDFQLLLTKKSNEYKINKLSNPTIIKNDFFNYLNNKYKDNHNYEIQNSTTAITIVNKETKFSIDIVIIRLFPNNEEIIRRNNKDDSGVNEYTWNKLNKNNNAYSKYKSLPNKEKVWLIENKILPRKIKEKSKNENDPTKLSSSEAFIVEVNNYVVKRRNN